MLTFIKKLLPQKEQPLQIPNQDLIASISSMVYDQDIATILLSPTNKLYIVNTYTTSFEELLTNILTQSLNRPITSVNLNAYFNKQTNIHQQLLRLNQVLQTNKVSTSIAHDLTELLEAYTFLKSMENNNAC